MKKLDYGPVKRRLERRRKMVAFTLGGACGLYFLQKANNLLIGDIGFSVEDQHRHIDFVERVDG